MSRWKNKLAAMLIGIFLLAFPTTLAFASVTQPSVRTEAATSVTATSATVNGAITATGGQNSDLIKFQFRKRGASEWMETNTADGDFGRITFYCVLNSLDTNTAYEFRAAAHNSAGWGYGEVLTLNTAETPVTLPTVQTEAATSVTATSATVNGAITGTGGQNSDLIKFQFRKRGASEWRETNTADGDFGRITFYCVLNSLDTNTAYEFRAAAHNSAGWGYGEVLTLNTAETPVTLPTVRTEAATSVTATSATVNGAITATGGQNSDRIKFQFRKRGASEWRETNTADGDFGRITFYCLLNSLDTNTAYEFRAAAHNSAGWGYGEVLTLITADAPVTLPVVHTGEATSVGARTATLNGAITGTGGRSCDQIKFQFRKKGRTNWNNTATGNGSFSQITFYCVLNSLRANTTYECRAAAHNSAGWGYGEVITFTTGKLW